MKNPRIIFAVELKRRVADASIYGIIVGKLCHKKKPCLVILFKIVKYLKVGFYCTILLFGLIVCL